MEKLIELLNNNVVSLMISGVFSILCVVAGWWLNEASTKRREKPKLCFNMTGTPDDELQSKETRTKTSNSDYGIEVYNIGSSPFIMERFSLYHKKKLLVECHFDEPDRAILPYKSIVYTLMEQQADALEYHCEEEKFDQCSVIAYDIEGKQFKCSLDVSRIALRVSLHPEDMIVSD